MKLVQFNSGNYNVPGFTLGSNNIGNIIGQLLPYLFAGAGFLLIVYLVIGGLEFMLSMGEPKKIAAARGKITNALLGFLVVFAAYLVVQLMGAVFAIEDLQNIFKTGRTRGPW